MANVSGYNDLEIPVVLLLLTPMNFDLVRHSLSHWTGLNPGLDQSIEQENSVSITDILTKTCLYIEDTMKYGVYLNFNTRNETWGSNRQWGCGT